MESDPRRRVVIYARVSTKEQHPENQLIALRDYAKNRGWAVVKEFTDQGISGAKESRPALNSLMDFARKRKADIVLCWRFDRFARSSRHLLNTLEEFRTLGIDFVSFTESIDTSTAAGAMVFAMVAAIAEFERALIRERVLAGLQRARGQGKKLGRPLLAPNQDPKALRATGMSLRAIAGRLGVSKSWVSRAVSQNPLHNLVEALVEAQS